MNKLKKYFVFIVLNIIVFSFILLSPTYVEANYTISYYDLETDWWNHQPTEFKDVYEIFLNKLSAKEDFILDDGYFVRFREDNDKLIIGSSGVVWCGTTLIDDLDKYGYDVVGFGGIPDNKMKEWIDRIDKKYNKIIYFSTINTLEICSYYMQRDINDSIFSAVVTTMINMINKILVKDGHLSYVLVKPLQYDEEDNDKDRIEFCERFNKMAVELNAIMDTIGVYKIDIKYPMSKEYSKGYVHYNNRVVWEDLLLNAE